MLDVSPKAGLLQDLCCMQKKKGGNSRTCHIVGGIIADAATDADRDTDADGVTDTDTDTHTYRYTY